MTTYVKKLLVIISIFAVAATSSFPFLFNEVEEDFEAEKDGRMTAVFINAHPRDEITLYWVNPEDDPDRLVSCSL